MHFAYFEDVEATIDPLRRALMGILSGRLALSAEERTQGTMEYREGKLPMKASKLVDRLAHFLMAVAGGAFLIVPMLIITLGGPSLNTSLITVLVAVLVVFVGTSSGGGL